MCVVRTLAEIDTPVWGHLAQLDCQAGRIATIRPSVVALITERRMVVMIVPLTIATRISLPTNGGS